MVDVTGSDKQIFDYCIDRLTEYYRRDFVSMKIKQFPVLPLFEIKYYEGANYASNVLNAENHDFAISIDFLDMTVNGKYDFSFEISMFVTHKNRSKKFESWFGSDILNINNYDARIDEILDECWKFAMSELRR